jgi:hypothetical protein
LKGDDVTYIFIDNDNSSATGYLIRDIGCDYLMEIKGRYGEITSNELLAFDGSSPYDWKWESQGKISAETDTCRLETQVNAENLGISGHFNVYFQTTDWSASKSDVSDERDTRAEDDDYPISSHVGIVNNGGTRGVGEVVGHVNQAPATIGWGDTTNTVMLNFSIEGSVGDITIRKINITHGGSGEFGDCRVFIYNESGTTPGILDGDIVMNPGGTILTGSLTEIDITDMDIGLSYKAYILITVVFTTTPADSWTDHYINITEYYDFNLTSASDNITGTFPLIGGPIEIIPEFELFIAPATFAIFVFVVYRRKSRKKNK